MTACTAFDQELENILQSHSSLSEYPAACTAATAKFSDISVDARACIQILKEAGEKAVATARHAERIQQLEAEKLTLTAAIHLDTIRKHAAQLEARNHRHILDPNNTASDTTINTDLACISENLIQMKCRMSEIIASINEEMDGINSELMDLL